MPAALSAQTPTQKADIDAALLKIDQAVNHIEMYIFQQEVPQ
jgi:hypothetical protein